MVAAFLAVTPFLGAAPAQASPALAAAPAVSATASLTPAQQLASMTMAQRVGQLFMVAAGATGANASTMYDLLHYHVGNTYLAGRSYAGVTATAAVVRKMTSTVSAATTASVKLTVATDQEGGYVQVLNGTGFSSIPTGLAQGTLSSATLTADAKIWGQQLHNAGLTVDLAPVLDTVTQAFAPYNAPIGYYEREYGYTPSAVSTKGNAFASGMKAAGVMATAKHFPGLGRVTGNTDVSADVHDTVTTRYDANLLPFKTAINSQVRWVMVSSAYYDKIDNRHSMLGAFSSVVMQTMLRGDAHFTGVILSDDLCNALQLHYWSLANRAADFFNAGGSMLLCGNPDDIPAMYNSVLHLAQTSPAFAAKVNAAALVVLTVKGGH